MNPINLAWWMGLPTNPLSHVGLSVAVLFALNYLLRQIFGPTTTQYDLITEIVNPARSPSGQSHQSRVGGWHIDYRLVIVGALLPDLIDKSLQAWFFPEAFNLPGRTIAHTLAFNSTLVMVSLLATYFNRSIGPMVFSISSAGHLLLDRMWESPRTLFWPQYGLTFGRAEFNLSPWWLQWMQTGIGPVLLDWTGALMLLIFAVVLYRRRTLRKWILSGVA